MQKPDARENKMNFARRPLMLAACLVVCLTANSAWAGGTFEEPKSDELGLTVLVDWRWAGTVAGGYYPIRMRLTNTGEPRTVTVYFNPNDSRIPAVERPDLLLESNTSTEITLLIPVVGGSRQGGLEIREDGEAIESLFTWINLPDASDLSLQLQVLNISAANVNFMALNELAGHPQASAGGSGTSDRVPPVLLPTNWLAYSGLDVVTISWRDFQAISPGARTAILKWARTGGSLLIDRIGEAPASSEKLARLLGVPANDTNWKQPDPEIRGVIRQTRNNGLDRLRFTHDGAINGTQSSQWQLTEENFACRDFLLGQIYAFANAADEGTQADYLWMLQGHTTNSPAWLGRIGLAPRFGNPEFMEFLIPGVDGVPVNVFLMLMTLFAIVIGPLNYIFLRRRNRIYLLLLTVPAIACVASLSLFAYSFFAHGFDVKSRTRTLTVVDQTTNQMVQWSRVSLFSGVAPGDGLKFSPETAVFPIWSDDKAGSGHVVWGEDQNFREGWFRSRTRTQFVTITPQPQRGRLEIRSTDDGELEVANGFEWDLQALVISNDEGRLFYCEDLPAGGTIRCTLRERAELRDFVNLLKEQRPESPFDSNRRFAMDNRRYQFRGKENQFSAAMPSRSLMEHHLREFSGIADGLYTLPPQQYVAVMSTNPGVDVGVPDVNEYAGYHVLWGRY